MKSAARGLAGLLAERLAQSGCAAGPRFIVL